MSSEGQRPNSLERVASLEGAKLLRLPEVCSRVGMRRTSIYALIGAGRFPPPVKVGGASAWVDLEITRWIESLVASRDARSSGQGRRTNARQTGNSIA